VTYNQVTDVQASQSWFERIFGYGHVVVNTAGTTFHELTIVGVKNYAEIGETINKFRMKKPTAIVTPSKGGEDESPMAILKKKLAKGEISESEFRKKKELLSEG